MLRGWKVESGPIRAMQAVALELLDEEAGTRMRDMELWEKVRRRKIVTSHGRKVLSWFACVWAARFGGGEARVWTRNPEGEALQVQHLTLANAMAAFFSATRASTGTLNRHCGRNDALPSLDSAEQSTADGVARCEGTCRCP